MQRGGLGGPFSSLGGVEQLGVTGIGPYSFHLPAREVFRATPWPGL